MYHRQNEVLEEYANHKRRTIKTWLPHKSFSTNVRSEQKDFSNQCGLDRSYFDGVERRERDLTFSSLYQICACLNCDIAAVTKGIPYPKAA